MEGERRFLTLREAIQRVHAVGGSYLTTRDVAYACDSHPITVIRWVGRGMIAAIRRKGHRNEYHKREVIRFLRKRYEPLLADIQRGKHVRPSQAASKEDAARGAKASRTR